MDQSIQNPRFYFSSTEDEVKELEKLMEKPVTAKLKDLY